MVACIPVCSGGPVVVFDPTAFKVAYPMFATLTDPQLAEAFSLATIYLRNDGTSPVRTVALQQSLLWQLTAHIAQLMFGINGEPPSGIVGRVNSASEGSVSVGTDWPTTANNAWFLQTTFGANFWQAAAAYRMARYMPGPTRFGTGIGGSAYPAYFPGRRR
jgi:hypothetical protein